MYRQRTYTKLCTAPNNSVQSALSFSSVNIKKVQIHSLFYDMFKLGFSVLAFICVFFVVAGDSAAPDCPRIKLKRQWGGKLSRNIDYRPLPVKYVIIHHTVTPECSTFLECAEILQNIQNYFINTLEYDDIGYK